jgi:hypothetical protein
MSKIGRNDPCHCGSGKKFKKCCLPELQEKRQAPGAGQPPLSAEVAALRRDAAEGRVVFKTLGVFILFSTAGGDAWVLETTEMDAVQVASGGQALDVEIEEDAEAIGVTWTHRFAIRDGKLMLTSYADQSESLLPRCPTRQVEKAIAEIRTHMPPQLQQSIHLPETEASRT